MFRSLRRAFATMPSVRSQAPAFKGTALVKGAFTPLTLSQYSGKYLVLFWYPADHTYVCPSELVSQSDRASEFEAINASVVGISVDSVFSHLAWTAVPRNKGGLGEMNIPLIGDISKEISMDYGMVVEDSEDDMYGMTLRGTAIIGPTGKLLHISNTDAPVGRSVDEILRLIKGACCAGHCLVLPSCASPLLPLTPLAHPSPQAQPSSTWRSTVRCAL